MLHKVACGVCYQGCADACSLLAERQPSSVLVLQLLKDCVAAPWNKDNPSLSGSLALMGSLKPGQQAVMTRSSDALEALTSIPAAQHLPPPALEELLQKVLLKLDVDSVRPMLALPAAQQLPAAVIGKALQEMLPKMDLVTLRLLLSLPAAQQLPVATVQQLLDGAADLGKPAILGCLQQCLQQAAEL